MKVVINTCYGGFGLSPKAYKKYLELQGRECYFFGHNLKERSIYRPVTLENAPKEFCLYVFDVPNPNDYEENELYKDHYIYSRDLERNDPILVQVVEELGEESSGNYARLKIVEIPDGVDYEIEEYDGTEWVAETHRTWS